MIKDTQNQKVSKVWLSRVLRCSKNGFFYFPNIKNWRWKTNSLERAIEWHAAIIGDGTNGVDEFDTMFNDKGAYKTKDWEDVKQIRTWGEKEEQRIEKSFEGWWKGITKPASERDDRKKVRIRTMSLEKVSLDNYLEYHPRDSLKYWSLLHLPEVFKFKKYKVFKIIGLSYGIPKEVRAFYRDRIATTSRGYKEDNEFPKDWTKAMKRDYKKRFPTRKEVPKSIYLKGENIEKYKKDFSKTEVGQGIEMATRRLLTCRSREEHSLWFEGEIKKHLNSFIYKAFLAELQKLYPFSADEGGIGEGFKQRKQFLKRWEKRITLPLVYALMSVDQNFVNKFLKEGEEILNFLTPQQKRVMELRSSGHSYKEIAQELGVGVKTIDTQIQRSRGRCRDFLPKSACIVGKG